MTVTITVTVTVTVTGTETAQRNNPSLSFSTCHAFLWVSLAQTYCRIANCRNKKKMESKTCRHASPCGIISKAAVGVVAAFAPLAPLIGFTPFAVSAPRYTSDGTTATQTAVPPAIRSCAICETRSGGDETAGSARVPLTGMGGVGGGGRERGGGGLPPCGDTWLCQVMIAIKEIAKAPTCTAKEKRSRLITDRSDRP